MIPSATKKVHAKTLLIDDKDYSQPQDHYFSYINARQGMTNDQESLADLKILEKL